MKRQKNKKGIFEKIADIYNDFNEELGNSLSRSVDDDEFVVVLAKYGKKLAKVFNDGRWVLASGRRVREPFELQMMAVGILSSMWTADIFNKKARDRKSVSMLYEYFTFKTRLLLLLNNVEFNVWRKPEPVAEALYVKDLIQNNQKKELKKLGLWPRVKR